MIKQHGYSPLTGIQLSTALLPGALMWKLSVCCVEVAMKAGITFFHMLCFLCCMELYHVMIRHSRLAFILVGGLTMAASCS
ncbi:unnamed protein product [Brassica rapa subsp. trilocularis]